MSIQMRATSSLTRLLTRQPNTTYIFRRSLTATTIARQPDLLQDMYLKELRAYKPPPQKPSDSEGQVQKFTAPKAPKSPEETNLTNDMKAYEDQVVEIEGQAASGETEPVNDDWFEEDEEPPVSTASH